jgi:hypothetical protein
MRHRRERRPAAGGPCDPLFRGASGTTAGARRAAVVALLGRGGIAAALILFCCVAARADYTFVQQQVQSAGGAERTSVNTTYISGNRVRYDAGGGTVVYDGSSHTVTLWDDGRRVYEHTRYKPVTSQQLPGVKVTVVPTNKTARMAGHSVREYQISVHTQAGPGFNTATGTIWATTDMPRPDLSGLGVPALNGFGAAAEIPGLPLKSVMRGPDGVVLMTTMIVSISTAKIPSSKFAVPSGYRDITQTTPRSGAVNPNKHT